jgi:hypothetical protein
MTLAITIRIRRTGVITPMDFGILTAPIGSIKIIDAYLFRFDLELAYASRKAGNCILPLIPFRS